MATVKKTTKAKTSTKKKLEKVAEVMEQLEETAMNELENGSVDAHSNDNINNVINQLGDEDADISKSESTTDTLSEKANKIIDEAMEPLKGALDNLAELQKTQNEFLSTINESNKEDAVEQIEKEIERATKIKEEAQKIINKSQKRGGNFTNFWNGTSFGY